VLESAPQAGPVPEGFGAAASTAPPGAAIAAIGTALPPRLVPNEEIAGELGVEADWIHQRTGIRSRRFAAPHESLTQLAVQAGREALQAAALEPEQLDAVLVATFTSDRLLPNAAPLIADALGARGAFACDLGAACTGFLSGLALGAAQIEAGRARHVLVIGADLVSRVTDRADRKTAGLFADGAGAALLGAADGAGAIGEILLHSDARQAECITAEHGERLVRMRGQDTFRAAVDALSEVTLEALAAEDLELDDVDLFVYHQANARITHAVGERLGLPRPRVVDCIENLGNTSAATLPLALGAAGREGRLRRGSMVLLAAFGAGFVWGGGLVAWDGEVAG
jgi:3-oxoacyl-[acyl-carrier-protein] synthase III